MEKNQISNDEKTKIETKSKKVILSIPKTLEQSKKYINKIKSCKNKLYNIEFKNDEINMFHKQKKLNDNNLTDKESLLLSLFIKKYHNNFESKYIPLKNEIAKPILYVFLLPFVSQENKYIIKIGYTTNIIKRHKELKTEFDVNEIKLLYCYLIDGEHTELNVHKNLKNTFNINIFNMKKNKKIENNSISEETYIYSWTLFKNIHNIIYRDYIMNNSIILLTKENENLELKKINNELELKKIELELKKSDNDIELKKMELKKSDNDVELKKIELELKKMEFELKKMEFEFKKSNQ